MKSEKEKAKAGLLYDANYDDELLRERALCAEKTHELNMLGPSRTKERGYIAQSVGQTQEYVHYNIRQIPYIPDYYRMRDRCKAVVQTGDYGMHAQAILIAGYSTDKIPMEWLEKGIGDL
ncbi:MAG: maltose acetyltransferase domain-containing protein [Prevotellaceae bacterium]|nr:maltose acetyltransferase domain-containing protein [Prevotellaceae bacterium]